MKPMPHPYPATAVDTPALLRLIDQCVMCGLCTPQCPTYRLEAIEAESPRGRIALARAVADGSIAATPRALVHLDHCLGCLSCQAVCPSGVDYDAILVRTRALLAGDREATGETEVRAFVPTWLAAWLRDPVRLTRLARVGAGLRAGKWLPRIARWWPAGSIWQRIAVTQPDLPRPLRAAAPPRGARTRGRITLFRGCVASVYDRDTLAAARTLLEALGYEVVETPAGECCGALSRHHGDIDAARAQADSTLRSLRTLDSPTVVVAASGCFGDLRDHVAAASPLKMADIVDFIVGDQAFAALRFRRRSARVALHLPCSQVNVAGGGAAIRAALARVPDLLILPMPEQPRCCGAAGSYFIEQPGFADRLRDEQLDQAAALKPDLIVTTNIGCRIHLGNGLRDRRVPIPVMHPLALLAEQLDSAPP
jgi:glycolate oxidase iron-sulfur subunit